MADEMTVTLQPGIAQDIRDLKDRGIPIDVAFICERALRRRVEKLHRTACYSCAARLPENPTPITVSFMREIGRIRVCDDCRRLLLTCDMCTAFHVGKDGESYCFLKPEEAAARARTWCLESFQQARPFTYDEIDGRLEGKRESMEEVGA